jgi:hypothetical protein
MPAEYIFSFLSLSAYIQPTECYWLLLLSFSTAFYSTAAPGWTLKNTSTAASPTAILIITRPFLYCPFTNYLQTI